jgi:hypothetical protein
VQGGREHVGNEYTRADYAAFLSPISHCKQLPVAQNAVVPVHPQNHDNSEQILPRVYPQRKEDMLIEFHGDGWV